MVILYYRSSYLRRILSTNKKKSDGTLSHIKLSNILPEIFQIILRYIYVTCVKVKDSNEILGGYNPNVWKSDKLDKSYDRNGTNKDNFIFSFSNDKIGNYILSRVTNGNYATINNPHYGPSFGGGDLTIWGYNTWNKEYCCSIKTHYETSIRITEGFFDIEECEVFQIV
ncbi:BTB/POZ protein [Rhizophagus irregularis DAOM 181602=DAOM 197198]|nr:BTB/POZ protein [Rhizophagus irregularis DAOM 181602=DAOM 197198]